MYPHRCPSDVLFKLLNFVQTVLHPSNVATGANEMAWWVKVLAMKPDDLGLTPGTQWEKGRTDSCKLSSEVQTHALAQVTPHALLSP